MQTRLAPELAPPIADPSNGRPRMPPVPTSIGETGLTRAYISDLVVKTLYAHGAQSGGVLSDRVCLPFTLLDEELPTLQRHRIVEVRGTEGHGRRSYVFDLTGEGRTRARELTEANAYVGPAPVPSGSYRRWVAQQSVKRDPIPRERIHEGLSHLVLDESFIDRLGPGINSGKSVFLYGYPGNGKTEIAFAIAGIMGGAIYIPHAVEIDGQILKVFDAQLHQVAEEESSVPGASDLLRPAAGHDARFVRVRRPAVIVGGELTLDELEPRESGRAGVYIAPPQMKANGGVFVIDDFGRQRVRPWDLLNRWMIPLDRGRDFLGLTTGHKIEVPFDCLIFFATNLNPSDLVEEAFLRRIRYKIFMPNPTRPQFAEILRRICANRGIEFREDAVELIYSEFYGHMGVEPRSCHPGDIVADLCDHARYVGRPPSLSPDLLMDACLSYFVDLPKMSDPERSDIQKERTHG